MDLGRQWQQPAAAPQAPEAPALTRNGNPKRPHPKNCGHCRNVEDYRLTRYAAEQHRESATAGYKTEMKDYGPIITFKDWLTSGSRQGSSWADPGPGRR